MTQESMGEQGMEQPRTQPGALDYQVTGRRIVAALIDIALLTGLFLVMAATMGELGTTDGQFRANLTDGPFLLYLLLTFGYYIALEGLTGATVGKLLLGLRVARLDGAPLGFGHVLVRNVLRIVDGLPFLYLVGLVSVAVTSKNQRIGDLAAGTTVVRA